MPSALVSVAFKNPEKSGFSSARQFNGGNSLPCHGPRTLRFSLRSLRTAATEARPLAQLLPVGFGPVVVAHAGRRAASGKPLRRRAGPRVKRTDRRAAPPNRRSSLRRHRLLQVGATRGFSPLRRACSTGQAVLPVRLVPATIPASGWFAFPLSAMGIV
jgi:hypothetical protein